MLNIHSLRQVRYSAISASPITATQCPPSPRAAIPPTLPSIAEGSERPSTSDCSPQKTPPGSPSRKGKKRLSFTKTKTEERNDNGAHEVIKSDLATSSSSTNSSVPDSNATTTPVASPTSPTFAPTSAGKQPRSPKNRAVSFAQPSVRTTVATDIRQPVLLDRARGIPGLMTILSRETVEFVVAPVH
ncbi:hypothetical protein SCHPADRAFT_348481 [Schizopora paradoxa]|uniref:Uncharacterized protein n=1 Tax=Schizopora paradoxa TaxID=27342 RepID=A0A0H2RPY4_9AGAM|nr:hypothetical protein SCHPADRAFT_348481 [Schizopora paradoxa]